MRGVSRARDDRGFTLVELMVVMLLSGVVMIAAYLLLDGGRRQVTEVSARTEATQRARTAMELMTRTLRSGVCGPDGSPPVARATPTSVDLWSDQTGGQPITAANGSADTRPRPPARVRLSIEDGALRTRTWVGRWSTPTANTATYTPALDGVLQPTATLPASQTLLSGVSTPAGSALFSYFGYPTTGPAAGPSRALTPVAGLLPSDLLSSVVRFAVTVQVAPSPGAPSVSPVVLRDEVSSATVDPADTAPALECGS